MKLNYFDAQCSISWKKFLLRKNSDVAVLLMLWQVFLLSFFVSFFCLFYLISFFLVIEERDQSVLIDKFSLLSPTSRLSA